MEETSGDAGVPDSGEVAGVEGGGGGGVDGGVGVAVDDVEGLSNAEEGSALGRKAELMSPMPTKKSSSKKADV